MMENLDTAGQEKIWYYQKEDGAKYGPYTDEELKRLIVNGILSSDDLIWMVDFDSFNSVFLSLWNGEMAVVINSDESVRYGLVMQVVTQVQKLGVTKLGFLTMNPKDAPGK